MSRNLCSTDCDRCGADVVLEEKARPMRPDEAGCFFSKYGAMLVANASCEECGARYLAWCDPAWRYAIAPAHPMPLPACGFFDLSYRAAFNDEPDPEDLPPLPPGYLPLPQRLHQAATEGTGMEMAWDDLPYAWQDAYTSQARAIRAAYKMTLRRDT